MHMFNYVYYYVFIIDSDYVKINIMTFWGVCSCQRIQHEMVDEILQDMLQTNQWIKITVTENNNNKKLSKTFKTLNIFPNPLVPFNKWNYVFL